MYDLPDALSADDASGLGGGPAAGRLLTNTRAMSYAPGTNVKGQVAGANWTFLLPQLACERIVCLGPPSPAARATFERLGMNVRVVRTPAASRDRRALETLAPASVDLLVICDVRLLPQLAQPGWLLDALTRVLKPRATVYVESRGLLGGRFTEASVDRLAHLLGDLPMVQFQLTPSDGEAVTLVPGHDRQTIAYLRRHNFATPNVSSRLITLARQIRRSMHDARLAVRPRHGFLIGRAASRVRTRPPDYICSIARRAGIDLDGHRWGLSAPGKYGSKKLIFPIFRPSDAAQGASTPAYIVKMVREQEFNGRVENEHRALLELRELGMAASGNVPDVAFFGHHAGLAIFGATFTAGVPFRERSAATVDCPHARRVLDWLTELGVRTAERPSAPGEMAAVLNGLFDEFTQIYRLTDGQRTFMAGQIARLAEHAADVPLVLQHGDPGPWNILIGEGGRPIVLDWELAERHGLPLLDLFYFLRSYCLDASRKEAAGGDRLAAFARHFFGGSTFTPFMQQAVERYCERLGLRRDLAEPLMYTCWMHRALREATRLPSAKIEHGHYANLLRLCIDRRGTLLRASAGAS
jgi:hypothetical protein